MSFYDWATGYFSWFNKKRMAGPDLTEVITRLGVKVLRVSRVESFSFYNGMVPTIVVGKNLSPLVADWHLWRQLSVVCMRNAPLQQHGLTADIAILPCPFMLEARVHGSMGWTIQHLDPHHENDHGQLEKFVSTRITAKHKAMMDIGRCKCQCPPQLN